METAQDSQNAQPRSIASIAARASVQGTLDQARLQVWEELRHRASQEQTSAAADVPTSSVGPDQRARRGKGLAIVGGVVAILALLLVVGATASAALRLSTMRTAPDNRPTTDAASPSAAAAPAGAQGAAQVSAAINQAKVDSPAQVVNGPGGTAWALAASLDDTSPPGDSAAGAATLPEEIGGSCGVNLLGQPVPASSWLCRSYVVHGRPPAPHGGEGTGAP
jgi:hypothetical protein